MTVNEMLNMYAQLGVTIRVDTAANYQTASSLLHISKKREETATAARAASKEVCLNNFCYANKAKKYIV